MKTELIRIGNSRGIRIPKPLIEQCGLGETVELKVADGFLLVSARHEPRHNWDDSFKAAGGAADDELLLDVSGANEFDLREWRW